MGIFVCIGQFLVAGIVPIVIAGNAVAAFRIIAVIVAIGFSAFQALTFWGVTENERSEENTEITMKSMLHILKRNDQLIVVGIAYILLCVGQQLLLLLAVNFFYFEFGYSQSGDLITLFTVMYGLGTLSAQFAYPILTNKWNRVQLLTGSIIAIIAGYLAFLAYGFVLPDYLVLLNMIGFVVFFCQGLFNLTLVVMVNNTIEYDEYRFGERHDSIISAIRSFAAKFSNALNQGMASLILIISGIYVVSQNISDLEMKVGSGVLLKEEALLAADEFIAGVMPRQIIMLRLGMVMFPLIAMCSAYYLIRVKYKIDEKEYSRIISEIEKRKKK